MDPVQAAEVLRVALVAVGILGVVLWRVPGPCTCARCGYHVEERRQDALRRAEARHDMQHRGMKAPGMPAPGEDRWPCDDPNCERNPRA